MRVFLVMKDEGLGEWGVQVIDSFSDLRFSLPERSTKVSVPRSPTSNYKAIAPL